MVCDVLLFILLSCIESLFLGWMKGEKSSCLHFVASVYRTVCYIHGYVRGPLFFAQ